MHTTESDGRLSPTELVDLAITRDLRIIAVTDHDSTEGLEAAYQAARSHPELHIIPGIELSTDIPGSEVHILGYFLNYEDPKFQETLREFRAARYDRGRRMVDKLREMGIYITWERVLEIAGGGEGSVGRPHIAQAMVEGGYIPEVKDAFDLYIGRNGPAYADRTKLTPEEAVGLIKSVGGQAVLAHPRDVLHNLEPVLDSLCAAGLAGMETYYFGYDAELREYLRSLCRQHDIIPCGGSDFHGIHGNHEAGLGNVDVPMETGERLFALAHQPLPV
jgi:3',5'-nucleoside bisphosphate phosphatase